MKGLMYIDFHAHHEAMEGERVVRDGVQTWGLHPWYVTEEMMKAVETPQGAELASFLAIGECGLDRCCETSYGLQKMAFELCVRLSEKASLPLILHCVRAIDDCLAVRKASKAKQPWIWHGYRGGREQLLQLLDKGFYFSFGLHYHVDALRACPLERLLLETDDVKQPVRMVYEQVARDLRLPLEDLQRAMVANYGRLFMGL